jgi:hypothetical protein
MCVYYRMYARIAWFVRDRKTNAQVRVRVCVCMHLCKYCLVTSFGYSRAVMGTQRFCTYSTHTYVCMHVHVCVCVYIYIYIYIYTHTHTCTYIKCVRMYAGMYIYTYAGTYYLHDHTTLIDICLQCIHQPLKPPLTGGLNAR